jgi:glutathione synthase/RimK-type ligase-like ATP-grasp enzyme
MAAMDVRLATCLRLPEADPDEALLVQALAARGVTASVVAWDDPAHDWDTGPPTVVRSTWNYIHALDGYLAWTRRAARAAPLWNPPEVIAGNAHKRYLAELARAGHAVVPTALVPRGAVADARGELARFGDVPLVIKPAVSAGSFATRRFAAGEAAAAATFLAELAAVRDVLVQPYQASVETHGERALVWIDGTLTHAVRKSPRFDSDDESVSVALPVDDDERALAEAVLAPLADQLLYARVDVARDHRGRPQVMELELIEPSLFLAQSPVALARLVDAIARRVA